MSDFDSEAGNDELWERAAEASSPNAKVDSLCQMAINSMSEGEFREALVWATEAVEASKDCSDDFYPAFANHVLANAAIKNEKWQQALEACEAASPYFLGIADETSLAQLESMRGEAYQGLDQYPLAINAYRSARDLALSSEDLMRAGWNGMNMAIALNREGRSVEAIEVLEAAGQVFKQQNMMREYGFTRDLCGESYHRLRLPDSALRYFDEAHTIFEFTNTDHVAAIMEYKAGRSLIMAGQPQQAIEMLGKVQQRFREKSAWNYAAECQVKIGLAYALMGDLNRATATLEQARVLLGGLDMPESSTRVQIYLAQLTWMRGNLVPAFEQYLKMFETYGTPAEPKSPLRHKFKVVQGLARLAVVIGRPEKAIEVLNTWDASNFGFTLEHQAETLIIEAQALRAVGKLAAAERIAKRLIEGLAAGVADHVLVEAHEVAYAIDLQRGRKTSAGNHLMMATALHNKLGNGARAAELTQAFLGDGIIGVVDAGPSGGLALDDTPFDTANQAAQKVGQDVPALWRDDLGDATSDVE